MANGVDENGEPLFIDAEGNSWSLVLLFGTGDMEQLCIGWGLASYNAEHELCGYCLANRSDIPYTDCQDDSCWRETCPLKPEVPQVGRSSPYGNVLRPLSILGLSKSSHTKRVTRLGK